MFKVRWLQQVFQQVDLSRQPIELHLRFLKGLKNDLFSFVFYVNKKQSVISINELNF